ncbi:hypothetical protein STEG23_001733 [Scotinomys teguina]
MCRPLLIKLTTKVSRDLWKLPSSWIYCRGCQCIPDVVVDAVVVDAVVVDAVVVDDVVVDAVVVDAVVVDDVVVDDVVVDDVVVDAVVVDAVVVDDVVVDDVVLDAVVVDDVVVDAVVVDDVVVDAVVVDAVVVDAVVVDDVVVDAVVVDDVVVDGVVVDAVVVDAVVVDAVVVDAVVVDAVMKLLELGFWETLVTSISVDSHLCVELHKLNVSIHFPEPGSSPVNKQNKPYPTPYSGALRTKSVMSFVDVNMLGRYDYRENSEAVNMFQAVLHKVSEKIMAGLRNLVERSVCVLGSFDQDVAFCAVVLKDQSTLTVNDKMTVIFQCASK